MLLMYVKALKLSGFKSFADATVLEFVPAVNVVVGPNGSGKSNIADALTWVLGSQAPSTLRGASMEDVIFAGSQSRSRLGMAQVELTFDNTSRVLPLDLNEVTIARIADRSGASEYRINGAPCRLLDVAELLSDTGIGRSIHTVVGQGQLDAVLQARPEERRSFIEDAAQVGKFRRRKDRSLRKMERVDDNLTRLNDVLVELRRSIRPLKRQAKTASLYSELVLEHRGLRQRLAATEIIRLSAHDPSYDPVAEQAKTQLLSDEQGSVRARLSTASEQRAALTGAAEEARARANRIDRSVDRLSGLGRLAAERSETISARLAAETEEGYRERIRLLDTERDRWSAKSRELETTASVARTKANDAAAEVDSLRAAIDDIEQRLARARAEHTQAAQTLVRAEGSEAAGRATIGSIEARVSAVVERRGTAEREIEADARLLEQAEQEVRALEMELDAKTEAAAGAETRLEAARERAELLKESVGASHAERAAAEARLGALEEVMSLLADLPSAVGRLGPLAADARERAALAGAGEEEAIRILKAADEAGERCWQEVAADDEELRRLDALMSGAAERLGGIRRRREKREVELAALDEELSRVRNELAHAERAATEERAALPAQRAALDERKREQDAAEAAARELSERRASAQSLATSVEMEARSAEERVLAARLRLEEAEAGISDAERALAGLEDLRADLKLQRERCEAVALLARDIAERGASWGRRADEHAEAARTQAEDGERKLGELVLRERELSEGLEVSGRRRTEAEIRKAQHDARIQAIGERAMDEWGLAVDDLRRLEVLPADEEVAALARAAQLDKEMRRLGAVNPRAAEEYSELAERETFLEDQIEDLKSSRRDLMKIVREVDETIVEVFGQAFEDVAREFEQVFQRLFPGGSGCIKLTDPDDLLKTGIEIEARPPGKNVRKLSLLSGGERSLVAIAFLFSIFRSRPSPFYLLDEVEAALDDVNLQRFLSLIGELEERAQVLIVTHQKRTMEAAEVLYGVSMSKDAVSRVVAKKFSEVGAIGSTPTSRTIHLPSESSEVDLRG